MKRPRAAKIHGETAQQVGDGISLLGPEKHLVWSQVQGWKTPYNPSTSGKLHIS